MNLHPVRERQVSIADVDVPLTPAALSKLLVGRQAYRRTRFVIARAGEQMALLQVRKHSDDPLFSEIVSVRMLAGPDEVSVVVDPSIDVAVPYQLAEAAGRFPDARAIVVFGRYEYVGFLLDPRPAVVRVFDVVPPAPAKLVDQVRRVLSAAHDLPPITLDVQLLDLRELAAESRAPSVLFPCRASGLVIASGRTAYLDQRPPREDWLLVGCERSRQIHRWCYGDLPPMVDTCPRRRLPEPSRPTLTRCCLLEQGLERDGTTVIIPWGASLDEVRAGLVAIRTQLDHA